MYIVFISIHIPVVAIAITVKGGPSLGQTLFEICGVDGLHIGSLAILHVVAGSILTFPSDISLSAANGVDCHVPRSIGRDNIYREVETAKRDRLVSPHRKGE